MPSFEFVNRERSRNTGIISCTVCLEEFQTPITCILTQNNNYATVLFGNPILSTFGTKVFVSALLIVVEQINLKRPLTWFFRALRLDPIRAQYTLSEVPVSWLKGFRDSLPPQLSDIGLIWDVSDHFLPETDILITSHCD